MARSASVDELGIAGDAESSSGLQRDEIRRTLVVAHRNERRVSPRQAIGGFGQRFEVDLRVQPPPTPIVFGPERPRDVDSGLSEEELDALRSGAHEANIECVLATFGRAREEAIRDVDPVEDRCGRVRFDRRADRCDARRRRQEVFTATAGGIAASPQDADTPSERADGHDPESDERKFRKTRRPV